VRGKLTGSEFRRCRLRCLATASLI
jgi:hypothetical protein